MSETLFFDKAHEVKAARKWARKNVRTEIVELTFLTGAVKESREREIQCAGDLGYHEWRGTGSGAWIIDHLPTGYQIGPEFDSRDDALLFVYLVRDLDWSFTSPRREYTDEFRSRVREASEHANATFTPESLLRGGTA